MTPRLRELTEYIAELKRIRIDVSRLPCASSDTRSIRERLFEIESALVRSAVEPAPPQETIDCKHNGARVPKWFRHEIVGMMCAECWQEIPMPPAKEIPDPTTGAEALGIMLRNEMRLAENYHKEQSGVLRFMIHPWKLNALLRNLETLLPAAVPLAGRSEGAAPRILSDEDIDQIVDGIEHFCKGPEEDPELDAIWNPYIDKLKALKALL